MPHCGGHWGIFVLVNELIPCIHHEILLLKGIYITFQVLTPSPLPPPTHTHIPDMLICNADHGKDSLPNCLSWCYTLEFKIRAVNYILFH